jgi:short-subunit dehydrogenase
VTSSTADKTYALVTGASKGLGLALAEALAARGANLILVARSEAELSALAERLRARFSISAIAMPADLADPSAVARLAADLEDGGVVVDLLINNAGLGLFGPFWSRDVAQQTRQVQVNIEALVALSHHFGAKMVTRGRGGIINVASGAGLVAFPFMTVYAASKAFVISFSEALANEMARHGVHVMVACPGPITTQFFDDMEDVKRFGGADTPEYVARRTLQAFDRKKVVSFPGRPSVGIGSAIMGLFPRSLAVKLAGVMTRKMGYDKPISIAK